jgi:hypothetical protein
MQIQRLFVSRKQTFMVDTQMNDPAASASITKIAADVIFDGLVKAGSGPVHWLIFGWCRPCPAIGAAVNQ